MERAGWTEREGSPSGYANSAKEESEDRLATRNSLQITADEERLEVRRNKRRKLELVQRTHLTRRSTTLLLTAESPEQHTTTPQSAFPQNQRIIFKDQSKDQSHPVIQTLNRTKRNKIFSQSYLPNRIHHYGPDALELENRQDTAKRGHDVPRMEENQQAYLEQEGKSRWALHEIDQNPPQDHPTVAKDKPTSTPSVTSVSKIMLSYPKFATERCPNDITPAPHSHAFRSSLDLTERMVFATEKGEKHTNPAAKKIKQAKSKKKTFRCSFSKLTLERQRIFGGESRSSNCLLPECLIRDNLADHNINIKLVESCSSEGEEGERYFDAEQEGPVGHKISYRNIDIHHSNTEEAEDQAQGTHNLFSDFEFPPTPKREQSAKELPRSTRKVIPVPVEPVTTRTPIHCYLIGLAVLLLVVQLMA